jgi:hypothetical protein
MTFTHGTSKHRLIGLIAALIAAVGAVAGPYTENAQAGRIGQYYPALVQCDTYHNSMRLQPQFGPSSQMSSQWLTYAYKIVNIDTGHVQYVTWRDNNNSIWAPSFQWSYWYVTGPITETRPLAYVRENYVWYDGGWSYSGWVKTTGYEGFYFDGGGAYCRTVSIAG